MNSQTQPQLWLCRLAAFLDPQTCTLLQKLPFHRGNLNSDMPGDCKDVYLHWGDVLVVHNVKISWLSYTEQL